MKNKEEKKNRIWVPVVIGAVACSVAVGTGIALAHNQQRPKASTVATVSDAIESVPSTTEVAEVTTEEATTEAVIEAAVSGSEKPEAVPATTEIGGGKKKAEETTEEQKPSVSANGSGHSNNSGNGQSTTPKPSNSGNSGNSGSSNSGNSGSSNSGGNSSGNSGSNNSGNSGNSGSNNSGNNNSNNGGSTAPATTEAPKPSTTEAPTTQHQHVYDQVVVDTPAKSIYHPEEGYYVPAEQCNTCGQVFTSSADFDAHSTYGGGSCPADGYGSTHVYVKTKDEYTETIPAKTHRECKCGARE